ncbi:MAG TPA: adenosylcobinamide-GDP ribazoletransferase [Parvibaculum sp.]|jgi:adenosylcobinamide-GDP ribazoletransferase
MRAMDDIRLALAFLTRLPISVGGGASAPGALARAMWAFPLAGAITGGIGGAVFIVAAVLGLPPFVSSFLALAAMVAATGALHEDGLADMADAGGGATRERKLDIMRDSRIGTYGVVALLLALLLRASVMSAYANAKNILPLLLLLISAGAVSRGVIVAVSYALPSARASGLSASAGRPTLAALLTAAVLALAVALLALPLHTIAMGMIGCVVGAVAIVVLAQRQFGGQTGDVLGASQQVAEIGFLLGALASLS